MTLSHTRYDRGGNLGAFYEGKERAIGIEPTLRATNLSFLSSSRPYKRFVRYSDSPTIDVRTLAGDGADLCFELAIPVRLILFVRK
jgi:hypothetical protein